MFFAPAEEEGEHDHAEGEEEGLGADLATVQGWAGEISAFELSDAA